jgi:tetratricopeptide (TPR) repeat protein
MARKALELDPGLAEAHAALGWVALSDWDWWSAEEHFRTAIDLNPNLLVARVWYASYLNHVGRSEEAFRQAEYAIRVDPLNPPSVAHAAQTYLRSDRVDEAIRIYRHLLDAHPDYWFAHQALGEAYTIKGMHRQAIPELEKALAQRGGDDVNIKGLLARAYVGAGEPERAREIAADFESRAKTRSISAYGPVLAYLALRDYDRVLTWLEQSYEKHGAMMMMLNGKAFDPLRSDPRFQDLVRRVALPAGNK